MNAIRANHWAPLGTAKIAQVVQKTVQLAERQWAVTDVKTLLN